MPRVTYNEAMARWETLTHHAVRDGRVYILYENTEGTFPVDRARTKGEMKKKLAALTEEATQLELAFQAVHPGEVLRREFMEPEGMGAAALARALYLEEHFLTEVLDEQRVPRPTTALRLARYWGTTAEYWMNLSSRYLLEKARQAYGFRIAQQVTPRSGGKTPLEE